ncbi:MAG: class I SAM-dependent methyltransferase [Proteobacteria bacterium]|nr:class I SAM-dependent methyltransferase [Pseudomonadota bacterium]
MNAEKTFTPALGYAFLTPLYDFAIAAVTRENLWRDRLVATINPTATDRILDVGCGTGSLAIRLKLAAPGAEVIGIDPDPEVIAIARKKSARAGVGIDWRNGFLTSEICKDIGTVSKIVSSLVFHQTALDEKRNILAAMRTLLQPGGTLTIADYGQQRTRLMRFLFRRTVQTIDGIADTQPNADGILPRLIEASGFRDISELEVVPTATGSISIYRATAVTS